MLLGIEADLIRVTVADVGGGFGGRGMLYPEYLVVVAAALELGQPVKWVAGRREDLTGGIHGRGHTHRVELSGDRQGIIMRARIEIVADMGAYPHNASMIPSFTAFMAGGPYRIDELIVETTLVVTNTAPVGTYRGAGRPEATYALERAVEEFARRLDLDPIDVRRANLITSDQLPVRTTTGALYDSGDYIRALDLATEMTDVDRVRSHQVRSRESKGPPLDQSDPPATGQATPVYR
jgi:carbon-monoxide dehydrogenase large subunit